MIMVSYLCSSIALLLSAAAAWADFRTGRIPNRLTLTGLALGLALGLIGNGGHGLLISAVGALIAALVPLLLFRFKAMGGGDVKLFAALGAIMGVSAGLEIQMTAFFIGAIQGMIVWIRNGRLRQGLGRVARLIVPPVFFKPRPDAGAVDAGKTELCFGPAISAATIFTIVCLFLGMV